MTGTVELLAGSLRLSLEGIARGMGRRDRRGMLARSGMLDPWSWSMLEYWTALLGMTPSQEGRYIVLHGAQKSWKSKH